MSPVETDVVKRLVASFPKSHLVGLKKIVFQKGTGPAPRDDPYGSIRLDAGGVLWIEVRSTASDRPLYDLVMRTNYAVARNVYRNVLSNEERNAFARIFDGGATAASEVFSAMYHGHVSAEGHRQNRFEDLPLEVWVQRADLMAAYPETTLYELSMASLFVDADSGQLWTCRWERGDFRVFRWSVSRTDALLRLGEINYRLEGGAITSVAMGDLDAPEGSARVERRLAFPVKPYPTFLKRFPLRSE
jgi:hypothetical protein